MYNLSEEKNNSRRDFIRMTGLSLAGTFVPGGEVKSAPVEAKVSSKQPVIILRSSWNDANIGDQGHTPGTLKLLERHIPEAEILLWHTEERPSTEAIVQRNFPKVKIIRGHFYGKTAEEEAELKRNFDRADLYMHGSGMGFNYGLFGFDWGGSISTLTPLWHCMEKGIPYGLYGNSFDRFAEPSPYVYRSALNKAAFMYCRDTESLKFIRNEKFTAEVMEFAPDGCFGIDVKDESKAIAFLNENKLQDKKFLTVVIRTNTPKLGVKGSGDLLNPAQATPEQQEKDRNRMEKIRFIITRWVRDTGMLVLLAPEVNKEINYAKKWVYDELEKDVRDKVIWREKFWDVDEAMSVYSRAHTVVGMEPHSLIIALAAGVPVVHVPDFNWGRKAWMFRDIGLEKWLYDIDKTSAATIADTVSLIHKNYPAAKQEVKKAMDIVKQRQSASMNFIRKKIRLEQLA
jgi:polysaccharide pyruvyl transferase WcaK-like protein